MPQFARVPPNVAFAGKSLRVVSPSTSEPGQQQNDRQGGQEAIVRVGDCATPASVSLLALQQLLEQIRIRQGTVRGGQPRHPTSVVICWLDRTRRLHPEEILYTVIQIS